MHTMAETTAKSEDQEMVKDVDVKEAEIQSDEIKSEEKKENGKKDGNESAEDQDSSEEELGSLEKPVEILSRKRDRKNTERFVDIKVEKPKPVNDLDYSQGKGLPLGDIEYICFMLNKTKAEELRPTFRILYPTPFRPKAQIIKQTIKKFKGFPFEKDSKDYVKLLSRLDKINCSDLKFACSIFGLERGGDKTTLVDKLFGYLIEPKELDKPLPRSTKVKRKSSSGSSRRRSSAKKQKSSDGDTKEEENSDNESNDDNEDEQSENSEDEEKTEKKVPAKKSPTKKKETKSSAQVKISLPTKKKKDKKTVKQNENDSDNIKQEEENEDSPEEEDIPLAKKIKSNSQKEPTDSELEVIVKELLKDADLEQVTMKTVCKQVYDRFPDFDLTLRKDFIKTTVKKIIS